MLLYRDCKPAYSIVVWPCFELFDHRSYCLHNHPGCVYPNVSPWVYRLETPAPRSGLATETTHPVLGGENSPSISTILRAHLCSLSQPGASLLDFLRVALLNCMAAPIDFRPPLLHHGSHTEIPFQPSSWISRRCSSRTTRTRAGRRALQLQCPDRTRCRQVLPPVWLLYHLPSRGRLCRPSDYLRARTIPSSPQRRSSQNGRRRKTQKSFSSVRMV